MKQALARAIARRKLANKRADRQPKRSVSQCKKSAPLNPRTTGTPVISSVGKPKSRAKRAIIDEVIDGYINATQEYEQAKAKLVQLRGGEERLTAADHTLLENIRDMASLSYEKYFEV